MLTIYILFQKKEKQRTEQNEILLVQGKNYSLKKVFQKEVL